MDTATDKTMSTTCKPRLRFSDVRRELQGLLLGAEMAHKADILTYSCGHLSAYSLTQRQPYQRVEEPIWEMSEPQDRKEGLDPQTLIREQAKIIANAEKMEEALFDFTVATALESKVSEPRQYDNTNNTPQTDREEGKERKSTQPQLVLDTSELFLVKPIVKAQTKPAVDVEGSQDRYWFTQSHLAGLTKKDQLKMMQQFDKQILGKQDLKDRNCMSGRKAAEMYERKLEKELRKLSVQSWPSREHLGVFSDVFDDVCDISPVFGDILREIKTDYDLYLYSILDSQSSLQDMSVMAPLGGLGGSIIGAEELEEAGNEVSRLGEEARKALEENDQVRNEFKNARDRVMAIPEDKGVCKEAALPGLRQGEAAISSIDRVQPKRRQVWNMWEEVQLLEKEIKEKMVSTITTSATEKCIRDSKAEIMRLLASNERFRNTNKDLESNISMVLNRVRASEDMRAQVWDKIWSGLRHEDE